MKKMTIDQVAELAYVSRSVVSRVLNDHPNVSEEARARVEKVIEEYNYRPSSAARSLATDRTFEICILTPRRQGDALANGFWTLLHLGIFEQCIERGYFVSLSMVSAGMGSEVHEHILSEHRFDGFILITEEVTELVAAKLEERDVPTVLVGHDPEYPGLSSVDVDNHQGAYAATRHLCDLGHPRVGAILGSLDLKETVERREGDCHRRLLAGERVPHHAALDRAGRVPVGSILRQRRHGARRVACPPSGRCGRARGNEHHRLR
jgi:LacI family transcriptional regulator